MTTNTSSFKRNIKKVDDSSNHRSISGVKPWLNCNLGIVSSGNRELDELIGGGVPLGTITLFATDTISNYGQTFLSYFITEGISIGHSVLILTFDETNLEKFMSNLPYNQNLPSSSNRSKRQPNDEDDDAETASLNELKLAASYKKYIGNLYNLNIIFNFIVLIRKYHTLIIYKYRSKNGRKKGTRSIHYGYFYFHWLWIACAVLL